MYTTTHEYIRQREELKNIELSLENKMLKRVIHLIDNYGTFKNQIIDRMGKFEYTKKIIYTMEWNYVRIKLYMTTEWGECAHVMLDMRYGGFYGIYNPEYVDLFIVQNIFLSSRYRRGIN